MIRRRVTGLLAGAALVAAGVLAAPAAHAAESTDCALGMVGQWLHLPGCGDPAPGSDPSPSASAAPLLPLVPGLPVVPAPPADSPPSGSAPGQAEPAPSTGAAPPTADPDEAAPVFTAAPPVLSGSALSLEGLSDIRVVEVRHADGSTARSLRISADRVVVEGFHLDVPSGDGGLANDDERMVAEGHVVVYADSLTGILATGAEVVVDTLSQPPSVESLRELTRLHIPLIGMTADRVTHEGSHQQIHSG
ncbi:hypothetical protein ACIQLJ_09370 [Microbacterium sp. NPDC091313]